LAICRRLIEMHGGQMWVETAPGAGSTFSFSLPLLATAPAPSKGSLALIAPPATSSPGRPILVIDDDPAAIEIVAAYLGRDGYSIYGLTDGRQALRAVQTIHPVLLLLDVVMPQKDGWDVLADLKAEPDLCTLPVVLYTLTDKQQLGFALGASAYLMKPVDEQELRRTVGQLVASDSRILVIDDDPHAREIVIRQLEGIGSYQVIAAEGGQAGLDQIALSPPELIILDLMMPVVDGFAVLDQLDRDPTTRTIPVIVLTAKDLTRTERMGIQQRVHALLAKDDQAPEQLRMQVNNLLALLQDRR